MKNATFFISKRGNNRILRNVSWIMEKYIRKLNKYDYWDLDPKQTLYNISLTTEHSNDILDKTTENFKNLEKDVIKEANWVRGAITYDSPCIIQVTWWTWIRGLVRTGSIGVTELVRFGEHKFWTLWF